MRTANGVTGHISVAQNDLKQAAKVWVERREQRAVINSVGGPSGQADRDVHERVGRGKNEGYPTGSRSR